MALHHFAISLGGDQVDATGTPSISWHTLSLLSFADRLQHRFQFSRNQDEKFIVHNFVVFIIIVIFRAIRHQINVIHRNKRMHASHQVRCWACPSATWCWISSLVGPRPTETMWGRRTSIASSSVPASAISFSMGMHSISPEGQSSRRRFSGTVGRERAWLPLRRFLAATAGLDQVRALRVADW